MRQVSISGKEELNCRNDIGKGRHDSATWRRTGQLIEQLNTIYQSSQHEGLGAFSLSRKEISWFGIQKISFIVLVSAFTNWVALGKFILPLEFYFFYDKKMVALQYSQTFWIMNLFENALSAMICLPKKVLLTRQIWPPIPESSPGLCVISMDTHSLYTQVGDPWIRWYPADILCPTSSLRVSVLTDSGGSGKLETSCPGINHPENQACCFTHLKTCACLLDILIVTPQIQLCCLR